MRAVTLIPAVIALLGTGCRPSLDGAWEGRATCNSTDYPVSALFDEQSDEHLKGIVYIEDIFLVGVVRADIDDGAYDPEDDEYRFDLQSDGDDQAEFSVTLAINSKDVDRADGDIEILDDQGATTDTCDLRLDRLSVTDN